MSPEWIIIVGWLALTGLVGFALMGVDKARARNGSWRISEKFFFKLAMGGGVFGILVGSSVFHHKGLKDSFIGIIALVAIAWVAILLGLQRLIGPVIA